MNPMVTRLKSEGSRSLTQVWMNRAGRKIKHVCRLSMWVCLCVCTRVPVSAEDGPSMTSQEE